MTDAELLSLRTLPTISITCVSVRGDKVKLGFEAPPPVRIRRDDLSDAAIPAGSSSNSLASS